MLALLFLQVGQQLHGWDLLIVKFFLMIDKILDNLPTIITMLGSTGFLAWWNARKVSQAKKEVGDKVDVNTVLTVAKSEENKAEIKSAVKDTKLNAEIATAAVVAAKKNVEKVDRQHEEVNHKLDTVVHQLNGGGKLEEVQKALAEHREKTKERLDAIDHKLDNIDRLEKKINDLIAISVRRP